MLYGGTTLSYYRSKLSVFKASFNNDVKGPVPSEYVLLGCKMDP
jgi:hypothetical protein